MTFFPIKLCEYYPYMEIVRLYSGIFGFENGTLVKYFYSAIMTILSVKIIHICRIFSDNIDIRHEYPDAYYL